MLGAMWAVEIVDLVPGTSFDRWGVRPRSVRGLFGIAFAPFLHVSFGHLIANTIPFVVLGVAIALGGVRQILEVTVIVAVVSGLGIWLFGGAATVHLGASGLVFGYLTYLVGAGPDRQEPVVGVGRARRAGVLRQPAVGHPADAACVVVGAPLRRHRRRARGMGAARRV